MSVRRYGPMERNPSLGADQAEEQAGDLSGIWHSLADAAEDPHARRAAGLSTAAIAHEAEARHLLPIIHEILEQDKTAPPKQRHTIKRIFDRLQSTHGYQGGITVVGDAVRAWRAGTSEVFMPLSHPPGEAQVDFGEATVILQGKATQVAFFVMSLP